MLNIYIINDIIVLLINILNYIKNTMHRYIPYILSNHYQVLLLLTIIKIYYLPIYYLNVL